MSSDLVGAQTLLQSPETSATVIHAIIRKKYGNEAYGWDLVTVMMELQDDFKVDAHSNVLNRWGAMQTIMTTDAFFKRLDAFLAICNTLSTGEPFFQLFDPVTVEEAAWAISEVSLNRELLPFAPAIKTYIRQILEADGHNSDIFDPILEPDEEAMSVREELRAAYHNPNEDTLDEYLNDQVRDMVSQFDQIPSLAKVDDILLAQDDETLVEAL